MRILRPSSLDLDYVARWAERLGVSALLRQVDAMAPSSELERAELLLRRLYPTLPKASLRQMLAQLAEGEAAGTWHGFQDRPIG